MIRSERITQFDIKISGVSIRFETAFPIKVPEELEAFIDNTDNPSVFYRVELLAKPLRPEGILIHKGERQHVYRVKGGWIRVYPYPVGENGCQAAVFLSENCRHVLYLPKSEIELYTISKCFAALLGGEYMLLQKNCLLLHSSVVGFKGKALLFSGPSGVGKSTQSEFWHRYYDAELINGDRCAISFREGQFWGGGSPYCGSSAIYNPATLPIQAIIFLEQGLENIIRKPSKAEAFARIYSQCILNTWDLEYTKKLCDIIEDMIEKVPMYVLSCLPDEAAVRLTKDIVFENERTE